MILDYRYDYFYKSLVLTERVIKQRVASVSLCRANSAKNVRSRKRRGTALVAAGITAVIAAITGTTATGVAIANRIQLEQLRAQMHSFEKTANYNFELLNKRNDLDHDIVEALNDRITKIQSMFRKMIKIIQSNYNRVKHAALKYRSFFLLSKAEILSLWYSAHMHKLYTEYSIR